MSQSILDERTRVSEINRLAASYKVDANIARQYIEQGKPLEAFQSHLLNLHRATPINANGMNGGIEPLGLSSREAGKYSIQRAITQIVEKGRLDGVEREASDAIAKRTGTPAKGFYIPSADLAVSRAAGVSRGLSAGVANAGGYTVATEVLGESMVDCLRNLTVVETLGARRLNELRGNVEIPKHDGSATAYWLAENAEVTSTNQTFGSIAMTPKRMAAATALSRQLIAQSSIDVESFIREDLMRTLAVEADRVALAGSGTNGEPLGILGTTGVNTVEFGAAATWAKVVDFETQVSTSNADIGAMHYVTTPAVRGKWKSIVKATGTARFLWDDDQTVNAYGATATNQVPENRVIFGVFSDLVIGRWEGIDIVIDPYTLKKSGRVEIYISQLLDVAIRNPEAFCVSTDAGNQ